MATRRTCAEDSTPLCTSGSVVSAQVPVGRQSTSSQRNLKKSELSRRPGPYSHLHTCPVTSRSSFIPTRWASVRARPKGKRETQSSLQPAVLEEAGSTARLPPPPSPPSLPSPAGVGPEPEERRRPPRRPPQRPQEGRRRAPQAMPLPGCSGGGRCERRRGSRQGAAAATEGPRAGGGGREGHRRRRR